MCSDGPNTDSTARLYTRIYTYEDVPTEIEHLDGHVSRLDPCWLTPLREEPPSASLLLPWASHAPPSGNESELQDANANPRKHRNG